MKFKSLLFLCSTVASATQTPEGIGDDIEQNTPVLQRFAAAIPLTAGGGGSGATSTCTESPCLTAHSLGQATLISSTVELAGTSLLITGTVPKTVTRVNQPEIAVTTRLNTQSQQTITPSFTQSTSATSFKKAEPAPPTVNAHISKNEATLWIQGSLGRFRLKDNINTCCLKDRGYRSNVYNTNIGFDYTFSPNFKGGITAGYGYISYKVRANSGKGTIYTGRVGLYGSWSSSSAWYADGIVYYGSQWFRKKTESTELSPNKLPKQHAYYGSGLLEVGRDIALKRTLLVTPYASGGAIYLGERKHLTIGNCGQTLSIRGHHTTTIQGKIGIQLSKRGPANQADSIYSFARVGLTYRRALKTYQNITLTSLTQGTEATISIKNRAHIMFNPSLGIALMLSNASDVTLVYDGELGAHERNHQALLRLNWRF